MKTILSITKKIVILLIILFIPISLLVATSYLSFNSIPLWNIGIRNILIVIQNLFLPILFIDYIISIAFVISFTDKMLLKSLIKVHIGAIIPAIFLLSFYYVIIEKNYSLKLSERKIYTGYLTYVKPESFYEIDNRILFLTKKDVNKFDAYILNKESGELKIFEEIKYSYRKEVGSFYLDKNNDTMVFYSKSGKKIIVEEIPLKKESWNHLKTFTPINKTIQRIFIPAYTRLNSNISSLAAINKIILMSALIIAIIVFLIPFCYIMNDALWGFSGLNGMVLGLTLIPVILMLAEKFATGLNINILGNYNFLLLAIIAFIPGILLDVIIAVSRTKK